MNPNQDQQEIRGGLSDQPPSFQLNGGSNEPAPTPAGAPQPPALSSMPIDQYRAVYGSNPQNYPPAPLSSQPIQPQPPAVLYQAASHPPIVAPIIEPQSQTVQDQLNSAPAPSLKPLRRIGPKRLAALISAVLVVLIGGAGYAFAFYLPGLPENVWSAGLQNTGTNLNAFVNTAMSSENLDHFSKYELDGSLTSSSDADSTSGTFSTKADADSSNSSLSVTTNLSGTAASVSGTIITSTPKNSPYPNIYLKATGLKNLGLDSFLPGIGQYDGQWIAVPSSYVKSLYTGGGAAAPAPAQVSKEDIAAAVKVAARITNQYVFTAQKDTAVFAPKQFIGREQKNGRDSYHYKAAINQDHAKAYCTNLVTALSATTLYTKLGYDASSTDDQIKNCQDKTAPANSDASNFDVWIDSKMRMLSAVRFPDTATHTSGDYVEVGQKLNDPAKIALYLSTHEADAASGTVTATIDRSTLALSAGFDVDTPASDDTGASKISGTLGFKPYNAALNTTAPSDALDIRDILDLPTDAP